MWVAGKGTGLRNLRYHHAVASFEPEHISTTTTHTSLPVNVGNRNTETTANFGPTSD